MYIVCVYSLMHFQLMFGHSILNGGKQTSQSAHDCLPCIRNTYQRLKIIFKLIFLEMYAIFGSV